MYQTARMKSTLPWRAGWTVARNGLAVTPAALPPSPLRGFGGQDGGQRSPCGPSERNGVSPGEGPEGESARPAHLRACGATVGNLRGGLPTVRLRGCVTVGRYGGQVAHAYVGKRERAFGLPPEALQRAQRQPTSALRATVGTLRASHERRVEAPPGFEPGMEVLQTSALPLGDGADRMRVLQNDEHRIVPDAHGPIKDPSRDHGRPSRAAPDPWYDRGSTERE